MNSKYEMIYKDYHESGLKLKEYCLLNNLNYHNTQAGIYHYKRNIKNKENNNIKDYILSSEVMRSDETPLNIINKDGKKLEGKTNSYVWVLSTGKGYHPS